MKANKLRYAALITDLEWVSPAFHSHVSFLGSPPPSATETLPGPVFLPTPLATCSLYDLLPLCPPFGPCHERPHMTSLRLFSPLHSERAPSLSWLQCWPFFREGTPWASPPIPRMCHLQSTTDVLHNFRPFGDLDVPLREGFGDWQFLTDTSL